MKDSRAKANKLVASQVGLSNKKTASIPRSRFLSITHYRDYSASCLDLKRLNKPQRTFSASSAVIALSQQCLW